MERRGGSRQAAARGEAHPRAAHRRRAAPLRRPRVRQVLAPGAQGRRVRRRHSARPPEHHDRRVQDGERRNVSQAEAALTRRPAGPAAVLGAGCQDHQDQRTFDEIAKGSRKNYRLHDGDARRTAQPEQRPRLLEAAACCDERPIGRTEEKGKIIAALVSDSGMDVPVISICGTPSIGKTTLARLVYGDPEVQNFFPVRIWVWLPDGCDVRRATKMIIEAVTSKKCDLLSLDILQQRLREHLSKGRFLLVIDNLWAEGFQFWESLRPSLIFGEKGSKILITTRNGRVSRMMSNILSISLKGLEFEECWQILQVYAFSGRRSTEQRVREPIGQRIASNCQGSPLAAKSLGVLLSDTNGQKEQWENILSEMQILEYDKNTNVILASLQISTLAISSQAVPCFLFYTAYWF